MLTAAVSIATFVVGLFLGHRFALGRDKRKEFNEAALPVRGWLLKQKSRPSPYLEWPTQLELDTFTSCLSKSDRRRLDDARSALQASLDDCGSTACGEVIINDPAAVLEAVEKLLPLTARR